jgi:hypothetical protein
MRAVQKGRILARRKQVRKLMLLGYTVKQITEKIGKKYHVGLKTITKDHVLINRELGEDLSKQRENLLQLHIARYEEFYRYYMDDETDGGKNYNPQKAMSILEKKERLLGFLNTNGAEVVVNNNKLELKVDDVSELKKLLKETDPNRDEYTKIDNGK